MAGLAYALGMSNQARLDHAGRVSFIRDAMASGAWTRAAEHRLMREWSVTAGQMVRAVAEARGVTPAAPDTAPKTLRDELIARLSRVVREGEDRDAIKASEALGRIIGANAPEVDIRQHMVGMPPEERRAYCVRLRDMCEQVLAGLEAPAEPELQ